MRHRGTLGAAVLLGVMALALGATPGAGDACCPAPRPGQQVVNADQTVLMIWDAARETQHFVRQASFEQRGGDFGFIVPSPTKPELAEADPAVFTQLAKVTAPEVIRHQGPPPSGGGCGCSSAPTTGTTAGAAVRVLDQRTVAGYDATVLEADTTAVLTEWLAANGFAYSPGVAAWAKPYVEQKWKFTALKVAAPAVPPIGTPATKTNPAEAAARVTAKALRITFRTQKPLFPYREPDPTAQAAVLGRRSRLLRIYFVAEARYPGDFGDTTPARWTGRTAWAGRMTVESRAAMLATLKLPGSTGPAEFHLTEFEDNWPYRSAPADVAFAPSPSQDDVRREPIVEYVRGTRPVGPGGAIVGLGVAACLGLWTLRGRRS